MHQTQVETQYVQLQYGVISAFDLSFTSRKICWDCLPLFLFYFFFIFGSCFSVPTYFFASRCPVVTLFWSWTKQFFMQSVPWFGHIIGNGVVKINLSKVEAIWKMPKSNEEDVSLDWSLIRKVFFRIWPDRWPVSLFVNVTNANSSDINKKPWKFISRDLKIVIFPGKQLFK
jgi:hypothetical protein